MKAILYGAARKGSPSYIMNSDHSFPSYTSSSIIQQCGGVNATFHTNQENQVEEAASEDPFECHSSNKRVLAAASVCHL